MKTLLKEPVLQKPKIQRNPIIYYQNDKSKPVKATGTCLGECVKCGASCCMDAGHPGPHFCFLCK